MPKTEGPPAFLFYPDDFSSDGKVEAMATEEVGAYILLLCKSWREDPPGSIPNDDAVLARWARLTPDRWAACRTGVLAAFVLGTDSRWHQKRMRAEYARLRSSMQQKREAGKLGAESLWNKRDGWQRHGDRLAEPCLSSSSSSSRKPKPIARASPSPDGFAAFWQAYPRKTAKVVALRAWQKVQSSEISALMVGLDRWRQSDQWNRGVIPNPASFLNQRRWEDEALNLPSPDRREAAAGRNPHNAAPFNEEYLRFDNERRKGKFKGQWQDWLREHNLDPATRKTTATPETR